MVDVEHHPHPKSLCHGCRFVRHIRSGKGSSFIQCTHPALPKYAGQPVLACDEREAED